MKTKKSSKLDLNKKSLLFFQLGLIVILFISWQSIEYKIYDEGTKIEERISAEKQLIEENIVLRIPTETPPRKVVAKTPDIEIVPDDTPTRDEIFELVTKDPVIPIEAGEIKFVEKKEDIVFLSNTVEEVPVFPGCEKFASRAQKEDCMNSYIQELVAAEFDADLGSEIGLKGLNRIYVTFKIDKNGNVVDVRSKATHRELEEEAFRVIKKIPGMTPGRQGDRPVAVSYAIPIVLKIK